MEYIETYKMHWKSKVTGKADSGFPLVRLDEETLDVLPIPKEEMEQLVKKFNENYKNAVHWMEECTYPEEEYL